MPPTVPTHGPSIKRVLSAPQVLWLRLKADSLVRNSVYVMATTVVTSLLGYAYWVVAARSYPVEAVGAGAAIVATMSLIAVLADLGAGTALVQVLPTRRTPADWSRSFNAMVVGSACAAMAAGVAVVVILPRYSARLSIVAGSDRHVLLFVLGISFMTLAMLVDGAYLSARDGALVLARNTVFSIAKLTFLSITALYSSSSLGILTSWTAGAGVAAIVGLAFVKARVAPSWTLSFDGISREMRALVPSLAGHHFINLGGMGPMFLFPIIVTARLGATENAYFYVTWMIGGIFFLVSPAVSAALFAEGANSPARLSADVRSTAAIIAVVLTGPVLLCIFRGHVILGLFGADYASHGRTLLLILALSAVPDAVTNIYVAVLRVQNRLRAAAALNLSMGGVALVLTWVLIPSFGIEAAGVGWLLAQLAGAAIAAFALRSTTRVGIRPRMRDEE